MGAKLHDVVEVHQETLVHASKTLAQKLAELAELHVGADDLGFGCGAFVHGLFQVDLDDAAFALDIGNLMGEDFEVVSAHVHPDGFRGAFPQV